MNNTFYEIKPSLSINITSNCNFNCIYCPPYGENFIKCQHMCNFDIVLGLVNLCEKFKLPVIRMTGGEPLLYPERVLKILETCHSGYSGEVILNTNGSLIDRYFDSLEKYKDDFLLKISLDSLDKKHFNQITNQNCFEKVLDNLKTAAKKGFKIEINTVVTNINCDDIFSVIKFAEKYGMNIKLFGINDFEGLVDSDKIYIDLNTIVDKLSNEYKQCSNESLPGDRGISMLKYELSNNHYIWIVNHNRNDCVNKTYSKSCNSCQFYPCATGKFSITLRSDGLLQGCRMQPENGIQISSLSVDELEKSFVKILNEYKLCYKL